MSAPVICVPLISSNVGSVRASTIIVHEKACFLLLPPPRIPVFVQEAALHILAFQWCVARSVPRNVATPCRYQSFEPNP
jgi:hypothetical protein